MYVSFHVLFLENYTIFQHNLQIQMYYVSDGFDIFKTVKILKCLISVSTTVSITIGNDEES